MHVDGKLHVPDTLRKWLFDLYHNSPESGGHDCFWQTYYKIRRFVWPGMKKYINSYIGSSAKCQLNKAKYEQNTDSMIFPHNSNVLFKTVHVDFAELKEKSEGVQETQCFFVCIDECLRMLAARKKNMLLPYLYWAEIFLKGWSVLCPTMYPHSRTRHLQSGQKKETLPWSLQPLINHQVTD